MTHGAATVIHEYPQRHAAESTLSITIDSNTTAVTDRLVVPTCIGCGAMRWLGTCDDGCREQRLELVRGDARDELTAVRAGARASADAFRAVAEELAWRQPAATQYESAYRSVQHQARAALRRFPDSHERDDVLQGPAEPATTSWCPVCGGIDAPQPCLEVCIWRSVEWVSETSYQQERECALSELLIAYRLRGLLRRVASVTPLENEWRRCWRALQTEARRTLDAQSAGSSNS